MRKIIIFSFIVMMIFSIPFVAAHPDIVGISINTMNKIISEEDVIRKMHDNKQNTETEFLSILWIFENFILLLTGIISVIVVVIVVVTYREEICLEKNCG